MIIISYSKQTWNEYNDSQTADENLANGGIISADRLNHMETGISNNDTNKVTDNKNGTEQLNGVQVQPFNKLSDTIGGRNLLINTAQLNDSTVCLDTTSNISDTYLGLNIFQANGPWSGVRIYWSYLAPKIKTNTNYVMSEYVRNTSPTTSANIGAYADKTTGVVFNSSINYDVVILPPNSGWTRISAPVNIASFTTPIGTLTFEIATALTDGYVQFAGLKFEKGSVATDWTPAPEDKVNVSDMRKPASDVAGIEEVNTKQDKIGYTPADASKVVHTSDTSNWQKQAMFNPGNYSIDATTKTTDFATLVRSKYNKPGVVYIRDNTSFVDAVVICEGNGWWHAYGAAGDGTFVHRRIRSTDDTGWVVNADDSKVAHLSSANNFDTVPTYGTNNKPFAINDTGATTARPTGQAVGYQYFDTTLNKPIWYNGSKWVDSTGKTV